jgi:DNA-binding transcriptional LysR family regulator
MAVNLPTELLRSFVAIVETGSMLQATERVFVTQSALSLQMRRLEDIVRQPLFHRQGRKLRVTAAGEHLLDTARQILAMNDRVLASLQGQALSGVVRIGLNQDFAEMFLPGVLRDFVTAHPDVQMQVRIGGSQELLDALRADHLDVVLCVRASGDAQSIKTGPMEWLGDSKLLERPALPLALLEPPCVFRATALRVLEEAQRPFKIVVETASLSGVRAAVQAGLAVTCRNPLFIDPELMTVLRGMGLPALPDVCFALHLNAEASPATKHLAALVRDTTTALL